MPQGANISVYLDASTLELLDAAVEQRASDDRARGMQGRAVTSRSSLVSYALVEFLSGTQQTSTTLSVPLIKDIVTPIARSHEVEYVTLFGSYARGEQTPDSDIDLYIGKGGLRGMEVFGFQRCLEQALGKKVDIVTSEGAGPRVLSHIEAEGVQLYAS